MAESDAHARQQDLHNLQSRSSGQGRRALRGRAVDITIGAIYFAFTLLALLFALITWWTGRLNPINALVFALAVAGTAPVGLLALRGDHLGSKHMDEGQRAMNRSAQADAFHVAYLGLYVLFFAANLFPKMRDSLPIAIGVLLLLVSLAWLGGYMWRRWQP